MFSKEQTTELKGVSVILLLIHHYFYVYSGHGNIIMDYIVDYSKICVTLFVLLSGYGLYKTYKNQNCGYFKFTFYRIKKIMIPFQIVFILFVLIGTIFNLQTLEQAYGTSNVFLKMLIEFLGLRNYFEPLLGSFSYNVTWWFIPMLLLLYVLFVPLVKMMEKHGLKAILIIWIMCKLVIPRTIPQVILNILFPDYLFSFAIAIFLSIHEDNIKGFIKEKKLSNIITLFLASVPILFLTQRVALSSSFWILSLLIIFIYIAIDEKYNLSFAKLVLFQFGKYSYQIYLTHTFIYYYFFTEFSYYFDRTVLVLLQGFIVSFVLGFLVNKITKAILNLLNKIRTIKPKVGEQTVLK